jgi:hypothetical protein
MAGGRGHLSSRGARPPLAKIDNIDEMPWRRLRAADFKGTAQVCQLPGACRGPRHGLRAPTSGEWHHYGETVPHQVNVGLERPPVSDYQGPIGLAVGLGNAFPFFPGLLEGGRHPL